MNVFVIGPGGSGQTVFLTMLNRYLANQDKELVFQALDSETGQDVANSLDRLEHGMWPKSNPPEDFKTLRWQFGKLDAELHNLTIFDHSRLEMRSVLLTDDVENLQVRPMENPKTIDESDLLLYLPDMDTLTRSAPLGGTNENSSLLKTFLTRPDWVDKRRTLVATKADLDSGMTDEAGGDLHEMIEHHCSPPCDPSLSSLKQGKIDFIALTSLAVTTEPDDDDNLERKSTLPLVTDGFEGLVDKVPGIGDAIARKKASRLTRMKRLFRLECPASLVPMLMRVLLIACALSLYLPVVSCAKTTESPCKNCGGDGMINDGLFDLRPDTRCPDCAGTGKIRTTVPRSYDGIGFSDVLFVSLFILAGLGVLSWLGGFNPGESGGDTSSVFIIGPEGSGKTVFLEALSRFADSRSDELIFEPSDFHSSQYVANARQLLERGNWPKSNPQGDLKTLKWQIGKIEDELHDLILFDYSGQDMRSVLLEKNPDKLQGRTKELREEIDNSDLLIYLLDVDGLIGSGSLLETNENFWLLKTFLTHPEWTEKPKIVVVTKAELYAEMFEESGGSPKKSIGSLLSGNQGGSALRRHLKGVDCYSLTSILTRTMVVDNSLPVRVPRIPLQSEGFDSLIEGILSALGDNRKKGGWFS